MNGDFGPRTTFGWIVLLVFFAAIAGGLFWGVVFGALQLLNFIAHWWVAR